MIEMKSIREEIRKSIEPNAKTFHDEKIIVDKAISIFEKRIDREIKNSLRQERKDEKSIEKGKMPCDDMNWHLYYRDGLKKVKEMLK